MAMAAATTTTSITPIFSRTTTSATHQSLQLSTILFSKLPFTKPTSKFIRPITKLHVSSPTNPPTTTTTTTTTSKTTSETVFFDGGAHYGDLILNLILGLTIIWLPVTLATSIRAFVNRYRFTNSRVTVIFGLTGQKRYDFSYKVVKNVKVAPRYFGVWGDVIITFKDGSVVDFRCVPKYRQIAKYCLSMAGKPAVVKEIAPEWY